MTTTVAADGTMNGRRVNRYTVHSVGGRDCDTEKFEGCPGAHAPARTSRPRRPLRAHAGRSTSSRRQP